MNGLKQAPVYRHKAPAAYRGEMSRLNGPVRRGFAVAAIACAALVASVVLGVGMLV